MKLKTSILQNLSTAKSWRSGLQLLVALALLGGSAVTRAATDTWSGTADINWNNAGNWDNPVATGDDLIFPTSTRLISSNDFSALTIGSISLSSSGYTLVGNALTITNGLSDSAGSNTCSIALTLGASQTFQNNAGGGTNLQTTQS